MQRFEGLQVVEQNSARVMCCKTVNRSCLSHSGSAVSPQILPRVRVWHSKVYQWLSIYVQVAIHDLDTQYLMLIHA